jgi:hypothetical protein
MIPVAFASVVLVLALVTAIRPDAGRGYAPPPGA